MKKIVFIASIATLLMCSCASEFDAVAKYGDNEAKYEAAKEAFARGKYQKASDLLQDVVTMKKGSDEAQECLYMLAMSMSGSLSMRVLLNRVWTSRPPMVPSLPISSSWISFPTPVCVRRLRSVCMN